MKMNNDTIIIMHIAIQRLKQQRRHHDFRARELENTKLRHIDDSRILTQRMCFHVV
jgi:hypothetical protein